MVGAPLVAGRSCRDLVRDKLNGSRRGRGAVRSEELAGEMSHASWRREVGRAKGDQSGEQDLAQEERREPRGWETTPIQRLGRESSGMI